MYLADVQDNYYDPDPDGTLAGSPLCEESTCYSSIDFQAAPYDYPGPETLHTAPEAVEVVLAGAGASLVRDAVDTGLVEEVRSWGTAGVLISDEADVGGPGEVAGGEAPVDSDGDGIPDEWEAANGLDPNDASDGMAIAENGYANLENYVNSLVA